MLTVFIVTLSLYLFQNATQNSLELIDDPKAEAVDETAAKLGLCKVALLGIVLVIYVVVNFNSRLLITIIGAPKSSECGCFSLVFRWGGSLLTFSLRTPG